MKKYIGTKQIEAEPMTLGEAYSMKVGHPKNCLKNHIEKSRKKPLSVSVML